MGVGWCIAEPHSVVITPNMLTLKSTEPLGQHRMTTAMQCLLPNLGLLRHQLEESIPKDQFRSTYFYLELLPYSLGATFQAFMDFTEAERELVSSLVSMLDSSPGPIAIGAGGRDKLSYRIDSFLEAARRTQNAVIPYLSKSLSISLPSSLADLVKGI